MGTIVAPLLGSLLLTLVFGVHSVDSASAWGLSPLAPLIIATLCLPVLWIGFGLALPLMRSRSPREDDLGRPHLLAMLCGLAVYGGVLVLVWSLLGGQEVLKVGL